MNTTTAELSSTAMAAELNTAFIMARGEFPKLKKTGTNPHFKSKFCPLEDIIEAVTPILLRRGLIYVQTVKGDRVESMMIHANGAVLPLGSYQVSDGIKTSQSSKDGKEVSETKAFDPQFLGSCVTYARRYLMSTDLGLAADDDDDGNSASHPPSSSSAAPVGGKPSRSGGLF